MVDITTLDECLSGISFPADADVIVGCTSGNPCPREVVTQIQAMGSRSLRSEEDLLCALGDESYCL
jgi:hypothetical protein